MKQHLHFLPVLLLFLSAKYGCPLAAVVCDHDHVSFRVERVASVEECLDVLVFRGMSLRSERNGKTADETDVDTAAQVWHRPTCSVFLFLPNHRESYGSTLRTPRRRWGLRGRR